MARKKAKFPKRIAGVKVPKPLRRTGTSLVRFANTPIGSAIVAEVVVAAAVATGRNPRVRAVAGEAGHEASRVGAAIANMAMAAMAPVIAAARNGAHAQEEEKTLKQKRREASAEQRKRDARAGDQQTAH